MLKYYQTRRRKQPKTITRTEKIGFLPNLDAARAGPRRVRCKKKKTGYRTAAATVCRRANIIYNKINYPYTRVRAICPEAPTRNYSNNYYYYYYQNITTMITNSDKYVKKRKKKPPPINVFLYTAGEIPPTCDRRILWKIFVTEPRRNNNNNYIINSSVFRRRRKKKRVHTQIFSVLFFFFFSKTVPHTPQQRSTRRQTNKNIMSVRTHMEYGVVCNIDGKRACYYILYKRRVIPVDYYCTTTCVRRENIPGGWYIFKIPRLIRKFAIINTRITRNTQGFMQQIFFFFFRNSSKNYKIPCRFQVFQTCVDRVQCTHILFESSAISSIWILAQ